MSVARGDKELEMNAEIDLIEKVSRPLFRHINECSSCHTINEDMDWWLCPTAKRVEKKVKVKMDELGLKVVLP